MTVVVTSMMSNFINLTLSDMSMAFYNEVFSISTQKSELVIFFTILQLSIILLAARVGSVIAVRFWQTAVVGEIIAGIVLGPSLFGLMMPTVFHYVFHSISSVPIDVLSQIGLTLLMFQVGLEFDFSHLRSRDNQRSVFLIAIASIFFPFVLGIGFGLLTADTLAPHVQPLIYALFVATAFSITAVPVLGRMMMELGITRTRIAAIAISAAAINDVIGWILLALVVALALSHFTVGAFVAKIAILLLFIVSWILIVRPLLRLTISRFGGNDVLTPQLLGIILISIFVSGMITASIGVFTIFGGFMVGVILSTERKFVTAWRNTVSPFVLVFFLPIFFTYTGLRTDISGLNSVSAWLWCMLVLALATAGKFFGSYFAARISSLNNQQSKIIGIMMNTRALMELIVINVGYDIGVISQQVFTMLVIMAIFSTVITTPLLRRWLPQAGIKYTLGSGTNACDSYGAD
ncbi:cation:proton antiporter [Acidithiobacillus sp. IBUN Pt1247-S3]|uniref:cation:proton antiporter n=1 Tax=Acidithiobacillus sp. IBUN Pt1247-S3 TaxID=3166642 RepID=UPI0034E5A7C1